MRIPKEDNIVLNYSHSYVLIFPLEKFNDTKG
ncbi:hypothetical protein OENI_120012 [Oenococcus oeni]|nr:hypothetical protein OENI_120012 [Oenococcus oeni]